MIKQGSQIDFNGKYQPSDTLDINIFSRAMLYGDCVYEQISAVDLFKQSAHGGIKHHFYDISFHAGFRPVRSISAGRGPYQTK